MLKINPTKLLRTSLLTLGLLGILHSNIQAEEIEQKDFIERLYQNILGRSSDTTGMNTWMSTIQNQSATQVAMGFLNSQELANKNLSNEEYLDILYQTLFDRQADSGGRNDWLEKMRNGRTKQSVMFGFFQSDEFKNLADRFGVTQILPTDKPNLTSVESYVDRFYRLVLKRNYDETGFNDWVNQLTNKTKDPTEIANGFLFSSEYINQNEDNSTYLDTCYQAFFGRASDESGKNDWLNKIANQGYTKQQIFEGFTGSQEFTNLVNSFNLDNVDNDAPSITSNSNFTVNENQTSAFTIIATDNSTITYSISGTDASLFNVDSTTGVVTFKTNPDFETKTSYSIKVRAMDSSNNVSTKDVVVSINNIDEIIYDIMFNGTGYNIITSPITGRQWLDRNLGASRVCTASNDTSCYGDYYQWGRLADGHEKANSITTFTLATDIANAGNKFITNYTSYSNDWISSDSTGSNRIIQWNKIDGTGICPTGFRVPTDTELLSETTNYRGINDTTSGAVKLINTITAFQNFLKLPASGYRKYFDGYIESKGSWGGLWTNTDRGYGSYGMGFASWESYWTGFKTQGLPVRCIQGN